MDNLVNPQFYYYNVSPRAYAQILVLLSNRLVYLSNLDRLGDSLKRVLRRKIFYWGVGRLLEGGSVLLKKPWVIPL
jgi:hypothetical protein